MFVMPVKTFSNKLKLSFIRDIASKVCSKDAMDLLTSSKNKSRSKFLKQRYLYLFG